MSGSSNGRYNEQETGDYNGRYHKQMPGKFNGKHNKQMSGKSNVKHNKLSECQAVFENRLQKLHNDFRRTYNVSPLKLDNKLTNSIKTLTDRMVSSKSLSLTGNKNYGSNKFSSSLYDFSINECESLADRFFDSFSKSARFYNYNDPGFTSKTGGFTQLVWKSSKQLGCGVSFTDLSKHEKWAYAACYYYPAGNMIGSFEQNVLRPRK